MFSRHAEFCRQPAVRFATALIPLACPPCGCAVTNRQLARARCQTGHRAHDEEAGVDLRIASSELLRLADGGRRLTLKSLSGANNTLRPPHCLNVHHTCVDIRKKRFQGAMQQIEAADGRGCHLISAAIPVPLASLSTLGFR